MKKLPLKYFDEHSNGDVMSRITNDVDAVGQTLVHSLGSLIKSVTLFFGALIMMFANNWLLELCAIAASLLGMVLMLVVMRFSQRYFVKQQAALGDVNGHVEEMYSGHTVVTAFGGEADAIRRFERYNNDLYESLCAIAASLLGMVLMLVVMRFSQRYFVKQQAALGDVNGHVEEMYSGHTVVTAFGGEADAIRRFERYNNDLYESGWKSQFFSGLMMPMMNLVGNLGYVGTRSSRRSAARRTRSSGSSATTTTCTSRGGRASSFPA